MLSAMSTRSDDLSLCKAPTIPSEWGKDPTPQLRRLRDEVLQHKNYPTPASSAFITAAWRAISRLPPDCLAPERCEALTLISRFHYNNGQNEPTIASARDAVQAAVAGRHRKLEIVARARLGIALRSMYDFSGSVRELVRGIEIAREEGELEEEAKLLNSLGNTYNDAGLHYDGLALFERSAAMFESAEDGLSAWIALDNAALAALRLGQIERAIAFTERARRSWNDAPRTADEKHWVVQGALTNCALLILTDQAEAALKLARATRALADASGLRAACQLAEIADVIAEFAAGVGSSEAMQRVVDAADGPSGYWVACDYVIRTYEKAGHFDAALRLQRRLLDFTKKQKFDEVHRLLQQTADEEVHGVARLARLDQEVRGRMAGLINTAINQSLRGGYDHTRIFRLSRLTALFARSLGWSVARAESLALSAKLLDIGMIVIPNELLRKRRELTEGERSIVAEHAQTGAELLSNAGLELLQPCIEVVRLHHETWDGRGPEGRAGAAIPIGARVVALCDAFDALTHERPWRSALEPHFALRKIRSESGTQFDPQLAPRFVDWLEIQLTHADFLPSLADEAFENEYVETRKRLDTLIRDFA